MRAFATVNSAVLKVSVVRLAGVFLAMVLAVAVWPASALAQEPELVVDGRVVNRTADDTPEFGLLVTLHQESTAGHVYTEATTDVDGVFRF